MMMVVFIYFLFTPYTAYAQKSATAQSLEKQGMVDVSALDSTIHVSLMYARSDNFTGKVLYEDLREALLHPRAAKALCVAQRLLRQKRPELSLKIYDATRPMSVQAKMWQAVVGTAQQNYVSNPRNGGGLHNYGMAVDVTLCDAQTGDTLDMGTKVDFMGVESHIDRESDLVKQHVISQEAADNRILLRSVMKQAGFMPLRTEWWHFNLITRAQARARYKPIR
ncbi:MAG: M15 family metallopeptidase [Bacteroidaceae bacterium]